MLLTDKEYVKGQPAAEQDYHRLRMPETVNVRNVVGNHFHDDSVTNCRDKNKRPTSATSKGYEEGLIAVRIFDIKERPLIYHEGNILIRRSSTSIHISSALEFHSRLLQDS